MTKATADVPGLCEALEAASAAGRYGLLTVERPWSQHRPVLQGEFAAPWAIRGYLERELARLAAGGAHLTASPGREAIRLSDPRLVEALDENAIDVREKKLFLFPPERQALSVNRIMHYTGTRADKWQRYILLTNYGMHVEVFRDLFPDAEGPDGNRRQMPAWHHILPGNAGITICDMGVGPSNAKTITDHLAVLRPDLILTIGHCAGLRNHQQVGDLVLAEAFMRDDHVLDAVLDPSVPVLSSFALNALLLEEITARGLSGNYRMGTVYTTDNRNWEFLQETRTRLQQARPVAADMEAGTVAANARRHRIATAAVLVVSDKPLHGKPKLSDQAQLLYEASKQAHVEIAVAVIDKVRDCYPDGLPASHAILPAPLP